jgi:hypothetical protein
MQQDNNIENKLREMEPIEPPELGQMDAHWQHMAGMLQPPAVPLKKGWPKWMLNGFSAVVVVVLIGVAMMYLSSKKDNKHDNVLQKVETVTKQNDLSTQQSLKTNTVIPVITDSIVKKLPASSIKLKINPSLIYTAVADTTLKKWTTQDSVLATVKLNYTPCETCPGKAESVLSDAERKLGNLFGQLQKKEQYFIIDNSRDTLLQFKEGTILLIPANSFGGINGVELTAKEFYKTSDIILGQLNTMSNKDQLETGGMIHLKASYKGTEVKVNEQKPLVLVLPDTSENMAGMKLFTGDTTTDERLNWTAQSQSFSRTRLVTQARVINLVNEPYKIKSTKKGDIAYFILGDDEVVDRDKIKAKLKEKYNYYKVRLRPNFYRAFHNTDINIFSSFSRYIGDTVWMDISTANRWNLDIISTRQFYINDNGLSNYYDLSEKSKTAFKEVLNKYSVSLTSTGWINCDRFYNNPGRKVDFAVNLGDSAHNYYCVLLFDNIRSLMNGYVSGSHVVFSQVPVNLPVKIVSIGINPKGETVYSVTHTTTSDQELKGLQFQTTSAPDLKTSLSKLDK